MTVTNIILLCATVASALGLGGVLVALIAWRRFKPQDKAIVAKTAAEARSIDVDTYTKLLDRITAMDDKITDLERIILDQGQEIAKLKQRNRDLGAAMRAALVELLAWIRRALAVMSAEQQRTVGPPPDYQHLTNPEKS